MFLHDVGYEKFSIKNGDTLTNPMHMEDGPFDVIVSNPPYSIHWDGDDDPLLITDKRFVPAGVLAPKSKADMAFIMHMIYSLDSNGTAAIVCFPGIFYRKGAEQKIRQYMVDNNFVDAIIQLPTNLFFGTSIATCILVLKKNRPNTDVVFIDASDEFIKLTSDNAMTDDNIDNIVHLYTNRSNVDYKVNVVTLDEIRANKYNLSVSTYVKKEDMSEVIVISDVNAKLRECVEEGNKYRSVVDAIVESIERR